MELRYETSYAITTNYLAQYTKHIYDSLLLLKMKGLFIGCLLIPSYL
jgi:hypothetical protein